LGTARLLLAVSYGHAIISRRALWKLLQDRRNCWRRSGSTTRNEKQKARWCDS